MGVRVVFVKEVATYLNDVLAPCLHYWLAKYTVRVSQHHCGQISSTYLGGWEGRSPVRKGCGAQPCDFLTIFDNFWK